MKTDCLFKVLLVTGLLALTSLHAIEDGDEKTQDYSLEFGTPQTDLPYSHRVSPETDQSNDQYGTPEDKRLLQRIRNILGDREDLTIIVKNKSVTIQGKVNNLKEKNKIENDLQDIGGIQNIKNELIVNRIQNASQAGIWRSSGVWRN